MDLSSLTSPQKSVPLRCETKKRTDNGVITNAKISFSNGGKVEIKNGGKLVMRTGVNFVAPTGVMVDIKNGNILRSCDFQ